MIKHIHCFGTSYTAGGGFEFDADSTQYPNKAPLLKKFYGGGKERLTQYNFSWPGRLDKFVKKHGITVHNHAKSGYGNELMYRKTLEIYRDSNFNANEHLFLFEFSGIGRKEFYNRDIADYMIVNYNIDHDNTVEYHGFANEYYRDSKKIQTTLNPFEKTTQLFIEKTSDEMAKVDEISRNNLFFICFIKLANMQYYFMDNPFFPAYTGEGKLDIFEDWKTRPESIWFGDIENMVDYFHKNNLTITNETNGMIEDGHAGLVGNHNIATYAFNRLVDDGYIRDDKKKLVSDLSELK